MVTLYEIHIIIDTTQIERVQRCCLKFTSFKVNYVYSIHKKFIATIPEPMYFSYLHSILFVTILICYEMNVILMVISLVAFWKFPAYIYLIGFVFYYIFHSCHNKIYLYCLLIFLSLSSVFSYIICSFDILHIFFIILFYYILVFCSINGKLDYDCRWFVSQFHKPL